MVEHFRQNVAHRINGSAKAMIVTRSRLHCVRYHRPLDRHEANLFFRLVSARYERGSSSSPPTST
jgi:hypothetical protein